MDYRTRSTDSAAAAWAAFSAAAGAFDAPVPAMLSRLLTDGRTPPDTFQRARQLCHEARFAVASEQRRDADEFAPVEVTDRATVLARYEDIREACEQSESVRAAWSGVVLAGPPDERLSCRAIFGTGATCAVLDIWEETDSAPALYWLWCEGSIHGALTDPEGLTTVAASLQRRWDALVALLP